MLSHASGGEPAPPIARRTSATNARTTGVSSRNSSALMPSVWRVLQVHLRLAVRGQPSGGHAVAAARGQVRLAQAVAQCQLAPVARVRVLLQLVRAADRRQRSNLRDPFGRIGGAGALPRRDPALLEQPDRVLAQPV